MDYDAAFGPMGALSVPYSKDVEDAQRLLNALGFGPLKVDGLLGPETSTAMQAWYATLGASWGGSVTPADVQRMQQRLQQSGISTRTSTGESAVTASATKPVVPSLPWLTPTVLAGGVIALSVIGYFWWRSSQGAVSGLDDEDEDDKKCSRTPTVDFDSGKPVEK